MITDEQIDYLLEYMYQYRLLDVVLDEDGDRLKRTLNEYEQSKWIQFDKDDESTWPKDDSLVICFITPLQNKTKNSVEQCIFIMNMMIRAETIQCFMIFHGEVAG